MLSKVQIDEAAKEYADTVNTAFYSNDSKGFKAGANFVLQNLQQCSVNGLSEQLAALDDEIVLEPIQNALYATNSFTTDECSRIAEGVLMYIKEAGLKIHLS